MIKLEEKTPWIYYEQSRDFQFIGRLYDVIFNSVKTNIDTIDGLAASDNFDEKLLDLLAMTLGFKARHHYNTKQLMSVCSILSKILRYKGTTYAIELAGNAVLNADGVEGSTQAIYNEDEHELLIVLSQNLTDSTLFTDLLTYIIPAGVKCHISREYQINSDTANLTITPSHTITIEATDNSDLGYIYDLSDPDIMEPETGYTSAYDITGGNNPVLYINNKVIRLPITLKKEQKDE